MDDEYDIVHANLKISSGVLPLSTTMRHHVGFPVEAHTNRYEPTFRMPSHDKEDIIDVEWRCLGTGPYPRTDNTPQLPPLNEHHGRLLQMGPQWRPLGSRSTLAAGCGHRQATRPHTRTEYEKCPKKARTQTQHMGKGKSAPALAGVRGSNTLPGGQAQPVRAPGHQHHGPGVGRVMHGVLHLKHNHRALMDCTRCWMSHCLQTTNQKDIPSKSICLSSFPSFTTNF